MRARGRVVGKPTGLSQPAEAIVCVAETLYSERKLSVRQIAECLGICKATLYACLRPRNVKIGQESQNKINIR